MNLKCVFQRKDPIDCGLCALIHMMCSKQAWNIGKNWTHGYYRFPTTSAVYGMRSKSSIHRALENIQDLNVESLGI